MKAALLDLLGDAPDGVQARSTAREYLQARILLALQDHGAFADWAFQGGTALRRQHGVNLSPPNSNLSIGKPRSRT